MGWIGVDFDKTLAYYDKYEGAAVVGEPIKPMVELVKTFINAGKEVRIFTARVWPITSVIRAESNINNVKYGLGKELDDAIDSAIAIRTWCFKEFGKILPITCVKDPSMIELYDDRAVQVEANTGQIIGYSTRNQKLIDKLQNIQLEFTSIGATD